MFTSNTKEDIAQMLQKIGVKNIDELFESLPKNLLYPKIDLPKSLTELELTKEIKNLANQNKPLLNFAGGGIYEHFIPAVVNAISSRGEFLTAYTPYQAEASQGTLQAIYEYQSCICALTDMAISNASHYDVATALAESALACTKIKNNKTILVSSALHPDYKKVLKTYFANSDIIFKEISLENGTICFTDLENQLKQGASAFILPSPNYFGCIEKCQEISSLVHNNNALLISVFEPISLALLQTPGEYNADFAVAEGQALGNAMNFGGPTLGIYTCKKEYVRYMSGRLCGIAKDKTGHRAFVLTLQAREQHIRRERASSNICSNQALCALNATIYLTLLGPKGLQEVAEQCCENAHYLQQEICKLNGFKLKYQAPFFDEFTLITTIPAKKIAEEGIKKGILVGVPTKENELLICATETKTKEDLQTLINFFKELK